MLRKEELLKDEIKLFIKDRIKMFPESELSELCWFYNEHTDEVECVKVNRKVEK